MPECKAEVSQKRDEIIEIYYELYKGNPEGRVGYNELINRGISERQIRYYFTSLTNLRRSVEEKYKIKIVDPVLDDPNWCKTPKETIIQKYADLYKKDKNVTLEQMSKAGVGEKPIRRVFGSFSGLKDAIRGLKPEIFNDISLDKLKDLFSPSELKQYNKFIVTTAITGCDVDPNFYASIKKYCTLNKAKLLILTASDPVAKVEPTIDKVLSKEYVVFQDTRLNSNLYLSTIKLSAKQMDPITNLERLGQRSTSFIYASPKQRMKTVPIGNEKLPHILYSTGAITKPNYKTDKYLSQRTATIAEDDHLIGALVVEIENKEVFHVRQIQADKDGFFIDFGYKYTPKGKSKIAAEAIVFGDWHSGETDPAVINCYKAICKELSPKMGVIHDLFSGICINHHELNNIILRARRAEKEQLSLKQELINVGKDLTLLQKMVKKLVIVKSNHDEFLNRYLEEGWYTKDPINHRLCLQIALKMLDGLDPLKEGIEIVNGKKYNNIKWLKRNEDYKIAKVQLGQHGDAGSNGAKGSVKSMENSYGSCITGHKHSPEILRNVYVVGTSTHLKLEYNQKGSSSWVQSFVVLYGNGNRQLINIINGKYKI